jgi:hypothetical protein
MHSEGGGADPGVYLAPVYLPQGSRVNAFRCTYYDKSAAKSGSAYLVRTKMGVNEDLATTASVGSSGYTSTTDVNVANNIIDNSQYAYFVYWVLPVSSTTEPPDSTDVLGVRMRIDYSPPNYAYLPLVRK